MRISGVIGPAKNAPGFTFDAWCQLISDRAEFGRRTPRPVPNPFGSGMITIVPRRDAAEVFIDAQEIGSVCWSMSEESGEPAESLVNVSVEPEAMPLVYEWAAALGGEFRQYPDVEPVSTTDS